MTTMTPEAPGTSAIVELRRLLRTDLREAEALSEGEIRYLVDLYYSIQEERIRAAHQVRSSEEDEPVTLIDRVFTIQHTLEDEIKESLRRYADTTATGAWALKVRGVGPVIIAGLMANIDVERATNASKVWRFAGLDPSSVWISREQAGKIVKEYLKGVGREVPTVEDIQVIALRHNTNPMTLKRMATTNPKGKPVKLTRETLTRALSRRPWNAGLKTLCWKLGESFVKQSGRAEDDEPADLYCRLYLQRKVLEIEKNETGVYAEQATAALEERNYGAQTDARAWYSGCFTPEAARQVREAPVDARVALTKSLQGAPGSGLPMLPPGRIHARAKRYAVKVFLVHFWQCMYEEHYERPAPATGG